MADDGEVKAPVTRLRRRLSVEQSEQSNSPGPSTPTKKRGGRLTAKPQLELIDENTPGGTKQHGKKTVIKDLADVTEEKQVTPSRRSARIKSNTSIVSETTQNYDSPRAKRAARRNSHAGSDTENAVTPSRQSKRTRKDSATSLDKLETTLAAKPYITFTEVIVEELDLNNEIKENTINDNSSDTTSIRKSPRLREKKLKEDNGNQRNSPNSSQELIDVTEKVTKNEVKTDTNNDQADHDNNEQQPNSESTIEETQKSSTPNSSLSVIKNIDIKPKRNSLNLNKSTSALKNNSKQISLMSERRRTKSFTSITQTQLTEGMFYSDNETSKKKIKKLPISKEISVTNNGSGDNQQDASCDVHKSELNTSKTSIEANHGKENEITLNKSVNNSKSAGLTDSLKNISEYNAHGDNTVLNAEENTISTVQSAVFFDDSSNNVINRKSSVLYCEDQCVPVVDSVDNKVEGYADNGSLIKSTINDEVEPNINIQSEIVPTNNSCEPMDIDETISNSIICDTSVIGMKSLNIEKPTDSSLQVNNSQNIGSTKPKRKSTNLSTTQNDETTSNESKSTLILSHNKDMSSAENSVSKSPVTYKTSNEILSKSANLDVKDKASDKKNISLDYSTSTPLQKKRFLKLGMQINTSIIETTINEPEKSKTEQDVPAKKSNNISTNSDKNKSSEDESEEEKSKSNLLDDEADVADDDYESGDSQDDEARKYEEENEIVEKGETLDSEEEFSNDSDYERDSFVVSSNEEDEELLSGSGDDLAMSDKELTLSKKSKDKYNERKLKEQKKASREMFESRHNLNRNEKPQKKAIKNSPSSESENENIAPIKKNKQRLDSTQEESLKESDVDKGKSKKKKRLSESLCESPNVFKNKSLKKSQRIDSISESEDDHIAPVKKNKNQILDSTQEESLNESNINKGVSNKKTRLSSLSKSTIEEQEISTAIDKSGIQIDPLSMAVKTEPKTPMKDFNLSSVQIFDNIKEVTVDNTSIITKADQTQDPLQATMAEEDEEGDSSISENSEIMKNYDSVLDELNNEKQRKIKEFDTSLNLNKKKKKDSAGAIVDELNLTRTKTPKKNKKVDNSFSKQGNKQQDHTPCDNEDSSDSIPLQFLFSEDSSDVDPKIKNNISLKDKETTDDIIPLKRTPGKTNILDEDNSSTCDNNKALFIIDTKGNRENEDEPSNVSFNSSSRKSKKNKSLNTNSHAATSETDADVTINEGRKETKKKKKLSVSFAEDKSIANDGDDNLTEISFKKSKKNKNMEPETPEEGIKDIIAEADNTINEGSSKKKKKHSLSLTEGNEADNTINAGSSKKKKKQSLSFTEENEAENTTIAGSSKKKKKQSLSFTEENEADKTINAESSKKKKKQSLSLTEGNDIVQTTSNILDSGKKNKKSKTQDEFMRDDNPNLSKASVESAKKQKPGISLDTSTSQVAVKETPLVEISKSKKRKRISSLSKEDNDETEMLSINTSITAGKQKKKRKLLEDDTNSDKDKDIDNPNKKTKTDDKKASIQTLHESENVKTKKNQKRKRDDDNDVTETTKVLKQNSFDKVQVTRLPASVLNLLDDKPSNKVLESKKSKVVSTASFVVEESRKRRNKPSNFLEESVYLNDDDVGKRQKGHIKKPKVLPFVPTATTSGCGFTTNFKIDIINKKVEFVAKLKNETNFKNDYLYGKRIKRFGTYEMYKKHRNAKLSKF